MSGWEIAGEVLGDPPPCSPRSQEGRGMKMCHSDEQEAVTVMTLIKSPEKQFSCSLFSGFPSSLRSRVSLVQLLSCVQLLAAPWTAACQASLSITNSRSLLKLMSSKPYAKLNSKDLNAIAKIIKLLQENIGMNLGDLGLVVLS